MKLTQRQYDTLRWLVEIGGTCECHRDKLLKPGEKPGPGQPMGATYGRMPALCGLHLVQVGCLEAFQGKLRITELGRRMIRV